MAEQTSCTKPGRVSSIEREPPPMVSLASRTSTERPARANVIAAASPLGPAPTTIASYECRLDINALIPYCSFCLASAVYPLPVDSMAPYTSIHHHWLE